MSANGSSSWRRNRPPDPISRFARPQPEIATEPVKELDRVARRGRVLVIAFIEQPHGGLCRETEVAVRKLVLQPLFNSAIRYAAVAQHSDDKGNHRARVVGVSPGVLCA